MDRKKLLPHQRTPPQRRVLPKTSLWKSTKNLWSRKSPSLIPLKKSIWYQPRTEGARFSRRVSQIHHSRRNPPEEWADRSYQPRQAIKRVPEPSQTVKTPKIIRNQPAVNLGDRKGGTQQIFEHPVHSSDFEPNYPHKKQQTDETLLISSISVPPHKVKHKHHIILKDFEKNVGAGLNLRHYCEEGLGLGAGDWPDGKKHREGQAGEEQNSFTRRDSAKALERLLPRDIKRLLRTIIEPEGKDRAQNCSRRHFETTCDWVGE